MKDIPVFSTENGVGSLTLSEIPHWGNAYIQFQSVSEPALFLEECVSFCKAAGAEHIYAGGDEYLMRYPLHTAVIKMCALRERLPDTEAALFPVQENTLEQWRQIYNRKMEHVANAAYMTVDDSIQMLKRAEAYFVHEKGELIGIGKVSGDRISAIAALRPGAGKDVVAALAHGVFSETVTLQVASSNEKAMRLYTDLGFVPAEELSRWYKIF